MRIQSLRVQQVRNLRAVDISLRGINVFFGQNGSGKTSLLEAVSILGTGRSFRTNRFESLITQDAPNCTVFGVLGEGSLSIPMGVSRGREGKMEAQIQGNRISTSAQLAEHLPLLSINATSFGLIESGPQQRRQFLDWGVFHVEQSFHGCWLGVQRALKQRNMLLRHGKIQPTELAAWDRRLAESGERLDDLRRAWTERFGPVFQRTLAALQAPFKLELRYNRGWEQGISLGEALGRSIDSDRKRGFTGVGPQRADLRLRVEGLNAAEVLSRGQQKLVVVALKLAQGQMLLDNGNKQSVYLVDDLPAELDDRFRRILCQAMIAQGAQVLVTCVDPRDLAQCWQGVDAADLALFHVEQGNVQPTKADGMLND